MISLTTVVSSVNLMMEFEGWMGAQSCVKRVYRSGLSTQPWGEPVLSDSSKLDRPSQPCGRLVRKSLMQEQIGVGLVVGGLPSFSIRMSEMMVADLKSTMT